MSELSNVVDVPQEIFGLKSIPNFSRALRSNSFARIVAIGSSSTAGRGDVVPYPTRLEMYLRWRYQEHFRNMRLDVINRGKGGEEAIEELDRFKEDILALEPSLVIWQVGTNAVFRDYKIPDVAAAIEKGLHELQKQNFDVVLLDPQYVPQMLYDQKADASEEMVRLIAAAAEKANVNLLRRWALMRHWHVHNDVGLSDLVDRTDPDKLHQSDWSTMQLAKAMYGAFERAIGPVP